LQGLPDEAVANFSALAQTARTALAETRQLIGYLRADPDSGIKTTPGLDRLPHLVEESGRDGLIVDLAAASAVRASLPPGVALAAYRVVQEALTNVRLHSRAATARVEVTLGLRSLTVRVADPGPAIAAAGRPGGFGLVGLRERVGSLGGELSAGPREGGGFEVIAHLPLSA
jgi:signal transduction histidine kinase